MAREADRSRVLSFGAVGLASLVAGFMIWQAILSLRGRGGLALEGVLLLLAIIGGAVIVLTGVAWVRGRAPSRWWPAAVVVSTLTCIAILATVPTGYGWFGIYPAMIILGPPILIWGLLWRLGHRLWGSAPDRRTPDTKSDSPEDRGA